MPDQPPTPAADRADAPIVTLPPPPEFMAAAAELGIEFEPGDVDRLGHYLRLLLETNKTTNLTAITDPAEAWRKHILDALTLVPLIASFADTSRTEQTEPPAEAAPVEAGAQTASEASSTTAATPTPAPAQLNLIDIGSGGGVPAIPLAIVMPDLRVTMVEATGKKVDFLDRVIRFLKLTNARVVQGRAETLGQDHKLHREKYDLGTARALGHLAIVTELLGPLIRPHGLLLAVKGAKADQELAESQRALGAIGLKHLETIETPTGRVVALEKTIRTPRLYPRKDGEPARVPLR